MLEELTNELVCQEFSYLLGAVFLLADSATKVGQCVGQDARVLNDVLWFSEGEFFDVDEVVLVKGVANPIRDDFVDLDF